MDCLKCGQPAYADFIDIGVGEQRISPYRCEACGWIEEADPLGLDGLADLDLGLDGVT